MPPVITVSASDAAVESALATIVALLDPELIVLLAAHLDSLARARAHGALTAAFNLGDGRVNSADISPRVHWQRSKTKA